MVKHDHLYKLLFSQPQMMRDLLQTFVCGDWLAQMDLDSLERMSDNYISDDLQARADNIVWRVRRGDHYVYLLIEFQSRVDTFMALRVLADVGLLYEDLIRTGRIEDSDSLPMILPVVLHSGTEAWHAAEDVASLLEPAPPGLEEYTPHLRYFLIDEGSYGDDSLARHDNLVASLFRLEQCREYDQMQVLAIDLVEKLRKSGEASLCRAFAAWLDEVVLERLSGEHTMTINLWEKPTMLSERFDEWEARFRLEGRQDGLVEGLLEGRREGEAAVLRRLLEKRFGDLPNPIRERLRKARFDELERWAERLLDVSSLDELFAR